LSNSVQDFLTRVGKTAATLLLALATAITPPVAVAEQSRPRASFSIEAFCADPYANMDKLEALVRSRIGQLPPSASHDNIVEAVIDRLGDICAKGNIPEGLENQTARFNTIVRDKRVSELRRPKSEEFTDSIESLTSDPSDFAAAYEFVDVIDKKLTTRQQIVFRMLASGMTQEDIAEQIGLSVGTVNGEKQKIFELLKTEFQLSGERAKARMVRPLAAIAPPPPPTPPAKNVEVGPSMTRIASPLGAEIAVMIKSGAEVRPIGGYAGPVMTIKIARDRLSGAPVDGIVMLPTPLILQSNTAGEQEMVVAAAREVGEGDESTRTFALYAFCKDEHLETPMDLSRYSFKSEVADAKVADILTRSDLRRPEVISNRLWQHYAGG
jgi:hypothetical protein